MQGVFIGNQLAMGGGEPFVARDPATQSVVWQGPSADESDVARAFAAAETAFAAWSASPLSDRLALLRGYAEALRARARVLAETISREVGKVAWESKSEVETMIGKIELSIAAQAERAGEHQKAAPFGGLRLAHRPYGVMAVFGPFNFPGHLPNGHIVPAVLAGNAVVFKPSEYAPGVALLMAEAWAQAGAPPGLVNVVCGGRATGAAVLDDRRLAGVLFTGSAETGAFIHRKFGGRPEMVLALEMGGNNPLIVWPPTDAEAAADLIVHSAFVTTGQRCSCARRLILPQGAAGEAVIEALIARAAGLRIGPWNAAPEPFMGPLVDVKAGLRARAFAAERAAAGARVLLAIADAGPNPAFLTPAIIDVTGTDSPDHELFGPVLQVVRAADFDEALTLANRTRFGLAAGLISDDEALWTQAHSRLRAGILNWNRPTTGASGAMPFGGPGLSGNGRPSAYYAADYCAFPVASQTAPLATRLPAPGMEG